MAAMKPSGPDIRICVLSGWEAASISSGLRWGASCARGVGGVVGGADGAVFLRRKGNHDVKLVDWAGRPSAPDVPGRRAC